MAKKDKKDKKKKGGLRRIFVDSENVGNLIPDALPDGSEVYFFLSDVNVYRKVYGLLDDPHFHVVDLLETDNARRREKNEMDLAIIAFIGSMIQGGIKKKDEYIILSFDKGYERAMHLLVQENPKLNLRREEMSLRQFVQGDPDPRQGSLFHGALPKNPMLRKKAVENKDWDSFRKSLSMGLKKSLRLDVKSNGESGAVVWFEYDFYSGEYVLYSSGTESGRFASMDAGMAEYDRLLNKTRKKARSGQSLSKKGQSLSRKSRNSKKFKRANGQRGNLLA